MSYNYFESDNGLLLMEEYIIRELLIEEELSLGNLIGNVMANYEETNINKIKQSIDFLSLDIPFNLIEIEKCDYGGIKYTKEKVKLSDIGKLYYLKNNDLQVDFPLSILRERRYKFKDSEVFNIPIDRKSLYDYYTGSVGIDGLFFSREFGRKYSDENKVMNELLENGNSILNIKNSYRYVSYLNRLEISNNFHSVNLDDGNKAEKLSDLGFTESCNIVYLFGNDENGLEMRSLKYIIDLYGSFFDERHLDIFKNIILKGYESNVFDIEEDNDLKYVSLNKVTNELSYSEINLSNRGSDYITCDIDLDNKIYVVLDESHHEKLDIFNLESELERFKAENKVIKGLVSVNSISDITRDVILVSNKGEIKIMNESNIIGRNRRLKGGDLSEIDLCNILYRTVEDKLLLITEKGYIKVLNLKEYKAKNKESKFVMGINLSDDDKVIFSSILKDDLCNISLELNGIEYTFDISSLISSKVNKGKKLDIESIKEIILLEQF